ncbi:anti-sigma factor family protein [Chloroflexota bacterium]
MDCEHIKELLLGYIDNEISDNERMLVDDHLSSCPACAMELEALAATESKLRQAYQEVTAGVSPSAGAWESIRQQVVEKEQAGDSIWSRVASKLKWAANWRHPLWRVGMAGAAAMSYLIVMFMTGTPATVPMWTAAEQNAIDIARSDPAIQALLDGQGVVYEVVPVTGDDDGEYYQVGIALVDEEAAHSGENSAGVEFGQDSPPWAYDSDAVTVVPQCFGVSDALSNAIVDVSNDKVVYTLNSSVKSISDCLTAEQVQDAAEIARADIRIGAGATVINVALLNDYDAQENSLTDEMVVWVRMSLGEEVYFAQVDLDERRVVKLINGGEQ